MSAGNGSGPSAPQGKPKTIPILPIQLTYRQCHAHLRDDALGLTSREKLFKVFLQTPAPSTVATRLLRCFNCLLSIRPRRTWDNARGRNDSLELYHNSQLSHSSLQHTDITWLLKHLKSPATRLSVQKYVRANNKTKPNSALLSLFDGYPPLIGGFSSQRAQ